MSWVRCRTADATELVLIEFLRVERPPPCGGNDMNELYWIFFFFFPHAPRHLALNIQTLTPSPILCLHWIPPVLAHLFLRVVSKRVFDLMRRRSWIQPFLRGYHSDMSRSNQESVQDLLGQEIIVTQTPKLKTPVRSGHNVFAAHKGG